MPQVINTNIASLNAQRNLNKSQGALSTSLQRLSSGMRINSAKDDAAGLAISERFTAQIRGLNQAVRNSNDGISLSQTAEGALGEVTNNLQRVRELAVQSTNATNSASDRVAMQQEVSQLISEIDRVATQTNFNGVKLLDGSFTAQNFQVGANVGETITVDSIVDATKSGLGLVAANSTSGVQINGNAVAGTDLTINGKQITSAGDAKDIAAAITASDPAIYATASDSVYDVEGITAGTTGGAIGDTMTLTVDGVAITSASSAGAHVSEGEMQDAINIAASATGSGTLAAQGITVSGTIAGDDLTFTKADGSNFDIVSTTSGTSDQEFDQAADTATVTGLGTVSSITSAGANLVIGGAALADSGLTAGTTTTTSEMGVTTVEASNALITAVDTALNTVNGSRATLGAVQNRFESVVTSLQTSSESLSAARSRIQDTDFAAETANLAKTQILQQAGMAMMSQANQLPQNVLSLLQ